MNLIDPHKRFMIGILFVATNICFAQERQSLAKAGGYMTLRDGAFRGYAVTFEYERAMRKHPAFTTGYRIDFENYPPFNKPPVFSDGVRNLVLGYELKFYPFYYGSEKAFDGVFIGLYPLLLYKNGLAI